MEILDKCQTVIVQLPSKSIVYEWLFRIHDFYRPIHTYVSIMLCVLGTVCNFCNIVVLTRKQMRTPVNMILTAMACCDTVVLFSNLIYTTHYTFVAFANCHPKHWSYGWAMFLIAHAHLSLVGHSSSVWLSVMLALIRYLTLRRRGKMNGVQIELRHSYVAIACVVVFVSIMNAPNFLTYKIMEMGLNETCVITDESVRYASAYVPGVSDMAVEADCLVFRLAFWISGTVFKVLPCLLLTILVSLLRRILKEVKTNRQRLLRGAATRTASDPTASTTNVASGAALMPYAESVRRNSGESVLSATHTAAVPLLLLEEKRMSGGRGSCGTQPPSLPQTPIALNSGNHFAAPQTHTALARTNSTKAAVGGTRSGGGGGRTDRTTRMLLVIVGVFLFTELPQGIMAMLSGMFSEEFRRYIYNNLGDILDLLSLCGACTSFIIYCTMSGQFRNEFRRVFLPMRLKCWMASAIGQSSAGGSGSNCHRYSETYLNHSRSGTGADVSGYGNGGGNANASPFLRPLSSMNTPRWNSASGVADDRHSLITYGFGGAEMTDVALLGNGMRSTPCSPTPYANGGSGDCGRTMTVIDEHDTTTRKRSVNGRGGDGVEAAYDVGLYDNDTGKFDYQVGATVVKSCDDGTASNHQQLSVSTTTTAPDHSTTNGYLSGKENGGYGPPFSATVNGTAPKSTAATAVRNGIMADVGDSPKAKATTTIISNGYYGVGEHPLSNNNNNNNNNNNHTNNVGAAEHRRHRHQAQQPIQIEFRI